MVIRLALAGPHTIMTSPLCARCPDGPAGCCASPPGVEWSDVGRIVASGGAAWLLGEIASGALRPGPRGLNIRRAEATAGEGAAFPRRCTYHGPRGCTIPPDRRAATCNYYLCDNAFVEGGEAEGNAEAVAARAAHDALVALYGSWDRAIADRVRARFPDGPPWDHAFVRWLGEEYERLLACSQGAIRSLSP